MGGYAVVERVVVMEVDVLVAVIVHGDEAITDVVGGVDGDVGGNGDIVDVAVVVRVEIAIEGGFSVDEGFPVSDAIIGVVRGVGG